VALAAVSWRGSGFRDRGRLQIGTARQDGANATHRGRDAFGAFHI
jgi:hypothetical protein